MITNSFIGLVWLFLQCVGVTCWPTSLSIDIWGCSMDMAGSKQILFCVFQKQEPTRKDCNQLQECISFLFFFFFDSISLLFRERKNTSTILEKGKTNFKHAFSTLSKKHAFSFWLRIRNVQTKRMKQLTESERIEKEFGMRVWRGLPHGHGRKQQNTFLCFPKAKAQQEKIAINF